MNLNHKVLFIIGATATGKSQKAIEIAQKFNGVIINCDSVQFYHDLLIGSAAPHLNDQQKVPHYLYSYVKAPIEMTAGEFIREFYNLIQSEKFQLKHQGKPLILVGGTGFYIQALEKGVYNVPEINPQVKKEIQYFIENGGAEAAYKELISFDPETKIHANDWYRIGRALEIKRVFNLKMSELKEQAENDANKSKLPFPYIKIGLEINTEKHLDIIQKRSDLMIKQGLVQETQNIIDQGFSDWAPLNSVGYFEVKKYLNGEIIKSNLSAAITLSTKQLVKKQKTWFKRDKDIYWMDALAPDQKNIITQFLN